MHKTWKPVPGKIVLTEVGISSSPEEVLEILSRTELGKLRVELRRDQHSARKIVVHLEKIDTTNIKERRNRKTSTQKIKKAVKKAESRIFVVYHTPGTWLRNRIIFPLLASIRHVY